MSYSNHCLALFGAVAAFSFPVRLAAQPPTPPSPPTPPAEARMFPMRGGYLGVGIQEITGERAKALRLPEEAGVEVTRVSSGSPAGKAGIMAGDVILRYNNTRVEGVEQFTRLVRETPAGRDARIEVFRGGAAQTLTARIASNSPGRIFQDGLNLNLPDIPHMIPGMRNPTLGIEGEALEGQLAQYFGVSEGVLVRSVAKDSNAEKAGIRAGDVIVKVDGGRVETPGELTRRLRRFAGRGVNLTLMRDKREITVTANLEASGRPGGLGRVHELLDPDQ